MSGSFLRRRFVSAGQVEPKRAAFARCADAADFPPQQPRDLAGDRKPQSRAAVLAAGRPIGLLERLENDPQFLDRNADSGVRDREGDDLIGLVKRLVSVIGTAFNRLDVERDAAPTGE